MIDFTHAGYPPAGPIADLARSGRRRSLVVKAVFDRLGAMVIIILVAPILLVAAVAVRSDGGPAFVRQTHVGRDGIEFGLIRFRSTAGSRVTTVGAWMRRHAIDELPQLFNVLAGAVALVGSRPTLPGELGRHAGDGRRRFPVKPGLTGLWQLSGRRDLSWEESNSLDLRYIEDLSLAQDALILWKTFGATCTRSGAP